jgi:predicted DNA-binding transcriptional regulator AlpA
MDITRTIFSINQIAEIFGISRQTVWNWRRNGILPVPTQLGGRVYWHRADIEKLFAEQKTTKHAS